MKRGDGETEMVLNIAREKERETRQRNTDIQTNSRHRE